MKYYKGTLIAMGVSLVGVFLLALMLNSWANEAQEQGEALRREASAAERRAVELEQQRDVAIQEAAPVLDFLKAWKPYLVQAGTRDIGSRMRAEMEAIAQRRLGLVADMPVTPAPASYIYLGREYKVQQVGMQGNGENLANLITWLGAVEQTYPYARVSEWVLRGSGARNSALQLTLLQPIEETKKRQTDSQGDAAQ